LLKLLIEKSAPVFAETWIVVPNHSAKQWLQKTLARDLGVCAQIKFIMPLSFNWEIIKNVASQEHKINIFSKDVLRWQIFDFILTDEKYDFLKQDSELKIFNLAEKIAQTLLQYNEEHPEIIAKWDGDVYEVSEANQWQVEMWLQLQEKLPTKSPVELLEIFDAKNDFKQQPANIILFATEQLNSLQKATILKLSQKQDVQLLLTNPSPNQYWFDIKPEASKARNQLFNSEVADVIEVGNPLLSSLGFNKMALFDAFLQESINLIDCENTIGYASLYQSVKQDIYDLNENPIDCHVDSSIKIHSCHNRKRELEVIKDEILANLDQDQKLNPEDIIVVSPDINDYVSNIKQVFNQEHSQYLPYHIDRVQLADNHYVTALMNLLVSFQGEMTSNSMYQLLSQTPILQKFNINENDLPRLKNWILDSNIRNFYSKQHKAQLGFESKIGNTWQFGKNRWLAGYMAGEADNIEYLSTFGDIVGQEGLFSACFDFLDLWYKYYQKSQQLQTPMQWFDLVKQLCECFLYNEINDDFEKKILSQLENKFIAQTLESQPEIPLVIVNAIIEAVITENNFRSEGQIGIRFQSWENAFVADAKLLIILGLNDGEFPKKHIKNDLDLFRQKPARLNKSPRQRDKNLMLTALTENADKLIMTYVGFDENNNLQPPSVILAELISYLQHKTNQEFQIIQHRMHGYHKDYFSDKNMSYNDKYFQLAQSFYDEKRGSYLYDISLNKEVQNQINLNDLMNFFCDPLQSFLKNSAEINHSIYQDLLQDNETYNPTTLESWQLKHEIFNHGTDTAIKTGIITDNKSGQTLLNKFDKELKPLIAQKQDKNLQSHVIDLSIKSTRINGYIETDQQKHLVSFFPGKASTKNLCKHWIKHLCYATEQSSYAYFENKSFEFTWSENQQETIHAIIEKWQSSFSHPWLFCPPNYFKITAKGIEKLDKHQYLKKFIKDRYNFPSEGQVYFLQQVEQYNEESDIKKFILSIIESVQII